MMLMHANQFGAGRIGCQLLRAHLDGDRRAHLQPLLFRLKSGDAFDRHRIDRNLPLNFPDCLAGRFFAICKANRHAELVPLLVEDTQNPIGNNDADIVE